LPLKQLLMGDESEDELTVRSHKSNNNWLQSDAPPLEPQQQQQTRHTKQVKGNNKDGDKIIPSPQSSIDEPPSYRSKQQQDTSSAPLSLIPATQQTLIPPQQQQLQQQQPPLKQQHQQAQPKQKKTKQQQQQAQSVTQTTSQINSVNTGMSSQRSPDLSEHTFASLIPTTTQPVSCALCSRFFAPCPYFQCYALVSFALSRDLWVQNTNSQPDANDNGNVVQEHEVCSPRCDIHIVAIVGVRCCDCLARRVWSTIRFK
jgi:hypothetical protein